MLLDDHPDALRAVPATRCRTSGAELGGAAAAARPGSATRWAASGTAPRRRCAQATYWQMKNRAGTVGRDGLGPLLGRLPRRACACTWSATASAPGWCRSPSPGCPPARRRPCGSVTLLQGAFSHFAFASPLPFDAGRSGALAGMLARINGPLRRLLLRATTARSARSTRWRRSRPATTRPRRTTRCTGGAGWAPTARRASSAALDAIRRSGRPLPFAPGQVAQHRRQRGGVRGRPPSRRAQVRRDARPDRRPGQPDRHRLAGPDQVRPAVLPPGVLSGGRRAAASRARRRPG